MHFTVFSNTTNKTEINFTYHKSPENKAGEVFYPIFLSL